MSTFNLVFQMFACVLQMNCQRLMRALRTGLLSLWLYMNLLLKSLIFLFIAHGWCFIMRNVQCIEIRYLLKPEGPAQKDTN